MWCWPPGEQRRCPLRIMCPVSTRRTKGLRRRPHRAGVRVDGKSFSATTHGVLPLPCWALPTARAWGTYGLEKSYQSTLAGGRPHHHPAQRGGQRHCRRQNATTFAAKDGSNLVLSLDVNVQEIAERYLNEAIAANTVENRGCAIVMDVKTGAILAMASKPDF